MTFLDSIPFFRHIRSPITDDQLTPLDSRCGRVQFNSPLTENDHIKLAKFLRGYPKIPLRIYGHGITNLLFLKHYPSLAGIQVDIYRLESTEGIEFLPDTLESFGLSQTETKKLSLGFLQRFGRLKNLYLESHTKDIEVISNLSSLEQLTIRSITLPNLTLLLPLRNLWSLDIKLGGTTNLTALSRLKSLKYLELWMVRGLSDISVISEITSLQNLFLQALKNVTAIPSLQKLTMLRRITLIQMKGIPDLSPLLQARSLEDIAISDAPRLSPEAFLPLKNHTSLKTVVFGSGSMKKNQAVAAMFPDMQHHLTHPFIYQ